jgi:hypothetical protein
MSPSGTKGTMGDGRQLYIPFGDSQISRPDVSQAIASDN